MMKKIKILLAEDNDALREIAVEALIKADFDVVAAETGEAAHAIFAGYSPDCVVTDINMHKMDGIQLSHNLREISNVPIVLWTYDDKVEAKSQNLQNVHILKDKNPNVMIDVLKSLRLGAHK